jgi:hypothetical protein
MKAARMLRLATILVAVSLAGCLEVEQHAPYLHGAYAAQIDSQPQQFAFKGDRAAWEAAITARVQVQDEFRRAKH